MKDKYTEIINLIDMQIYDIEIKGLKPSRIILGINIYKYLESELLPYWGNKTPYHGYEAVIMGLPITVDTTNKNLISVSCGTEVEYDLESDKEKFMDVLQWQRT